MRKRFAWGAEKWWWLLAVGITLFIWAVVFFPAFARRDRLAGVLAQVSNLFPFFVFISGFAVSLLLIAKDVALGKEPVAPAQRPFLALALLMAILGLLFAFGTLAYVETFPPPEDPAGFHSTADAEEAFRKATGSEWVADPARPDRRRLKVTARRGTDEELDGYVNSLYGSLSTARERATVDLFVLLNVTAAFCIAAVVNLVAAAYVKLFSRTPPAPPPAPPPVLPSPACRP